MAAIYQVQNLLRSTEEAKSVLETTLITSSESTQDIQNKRVLAVVSHKDDWDLTEEGCLFVCKYKSGAGAQAGLDALDVQRVFPIYGEFSVVIGQMHRGSNSLDARPGANDSMTKTMLEQPRAVITLSVNPAEGLPTDAHPPTFFTYDVQGLRSIVAECKRLKEVSDVETSAVINLASSTTHFSWLKPYVAKHTTITSLTALPQDLRQVNKPLLERLSPACAGMMGDDHADVQLIRDDWVRTKARWQASKEYSPRTLRLRIGTFNVNGKMPSQDLSAWIQGSTLSRPKKDSESEVATVNESHLSPPSLPPLSNMSPISLGDHNPFKLASHGDSSSLNSEANTLLEDDVAVNVHPSVPVDPSAEFNHDTDVFVLGFQELDLSTEALIYSTGTMREDAWCSAVFAALGEKGERYEKLVSKQLVGMLIVIIVKKSLKQCFGDVQTASAGAGILGVMGNKGGTAVRLSFTPPVYSTNDTTETYSREAESDTSVEGETLEQPDQKIPKEFSPGPTTFTFINAHLAAFDDMVEKRHSDFQDLSRRLTFEGNAQGASSASNPNANDGDKDPLDVEPDRGVESTALSVFETDVLFWLGGKSNFLFNSPFILICFATLYALAHTDVPHTDLNYRVDLPDPQMRRILRDDEWKNRDKFQALLRFDQLKKGIRDRRAFEGFMEGSIEHFPTYRFSPGLVMDKLGYDIKRKPAWTDRILYMHTPLFRVKQVSYTGHPEIGMSDHRPVSADFDVDMDYFDTARLRSCARELFGQVHDLDGETMHQRGGLKVEDTYVDFEKVLYDTQVQRKITVRNTSKSPCAFRFVPVQMENPVHPEWLHVYPMLGVLLPDESAQITLTAYVNNEIASILNQRGTDLSGTLILHTVLGKDHFISVSGEYQYTCFANKLSRLTRLRGPIRSMESPNDLLPENNAINAPREVMRLVNWMMINTLNTKNMFIVPGDPAIVKIIRECLDTGEEFPYSPQSSDDTIPLAFAMTLLLFLNSLRESIIPVSLHSKCLEMTSRDEAFELLDELPPASVNVWISITAFLHFIGQGLGAKDDQAERIASVFAPIFIRDDPNSLTPPISPYAKRRFLLYFIS